MLKYDTSKICFLRLYIYFESMFIKPGAVTPKEGIRIEKATGECLVL